MPRYVIVATKARDRWFDLDAVRTPHALPDPYEKIDPETGKPKYARFKKGGRLGTDGEGLPSAGANNPNGAPPLDWMEVSDEYEQPEGETMSHARFIVADVFDGLAKLEDDSVDLVFTSPPFLALRSYLPADHPDKHKEIGSEATPAAFLDALLDVVEACDRVLAPHGTLCFELGDTYAGTGNGRWRRGEGDDPEFAREAQVDAVGGTIPRGDEGWPLDKSLTGIPALFEIALAYGMNPLRPERTTPRWRVRNLVPWCRPNPPVGALGDKWRPATSYVTVACKARDRWFDLDAVRTPLQHPDKTATAGFREDGSRRIASVTYDAATDSNGAPPLDWLNIPTAPYKGAHYATFPPRLVEPFVESMCPPGGTVLDPFAGSGTTLMVATGHGRDAVGIDIDPRNADLAVERCGMFLSVE